MASAPPGDQAQVRLGAPVLHPRRELSLHLYGPSQPLHPADQDMRAAQAHVVAAGRRFEQQGIRHADLTGVGGEDGSQDQGLADISARAREPLRRSQCPVPCLRVQQPTQNRWGVETGNAPPVDRAGAIDQRRRVAVREEAVVRDGGILADPTPAHLADCTRRYKQSAGRVTPRAARSSSWSRARTTGGDRALPGGLRAWDGRRA